MTVSPSRLTQIALLVSLTFAATASAFAQPARGGQMDPAERLERQLDEIRSHVDMSDEQAEQLRPILVENGERRQEIVEQFGRSNRSAMRASMEALSAETRALIAEVLNEEQMAAYVEWEESRPRRPGRGR